MGYAYLLYSFFKEVRGKLWAVLIMGKFIPLPIPLLFNEFFSILAASFALQDYHKQSQLQSGHKHLLEIIEKRMNLFPLYSHKSICQS